VVGRGAAGLLTFDTSMFAGIRVAPGSALDTQELAKTEEATKQASMSEIRKL